MYAREPILRTCLHLGRAKNRRLHTSESSVILTKPKYHPNSVLLTSILGNSDVPRPYYTSFPPKRRFVTILPSEITHSCHQRPTFQILQSRSSQGPPTATLPPSLISQACPLIGQSSSWRTTAMAPTRVGYICQCRFRTLTPMGWWTNHIASWPCLQCFEFWKSWSLVAGIRWLWRAIYKPQIFIAIYRAINTNYIAR